MRNDYPISPVLFSDVEFSDTFWRPRLETNRTVTLPYTFQKCEETGRIDNFAKAGGLLEGEHEGIHFNDSDVFKVVEGAAYSLKVNRDSDLEDYVDGVIAKMAASQEEDGYLYTIRTIDPDAVPDRVGKTRWENLKVGHELYNLGHMYEAGVAYFQATGKRLLLDVALKSADLLCQVFGPEKVRDVPGHQEIEIGLARLYRVTGDHHYLDLAKFFLDERGRDREEDDGAEYRQDHQPVLDQEEAVGHAVRAGYMYSGMADIAALTGSEKFVDAIDRIWNDVNTSKLYLTGGIGARHKGEAFGDAYELPNDTAYAETCAAIANAMWNHRMFLLHGDSSYMDVVERVIYNGFLSGISLEGDTFFYPNPLEWDGVSQFNKGSGTRQPWFDCSCCPSNVVRFIPSLPGYVYAYQGSELYVNLYIGSQSSISMGEGVVNITQETNYPWEGTVIITVDPEIQKEWTLCLRIPGWARGHPAPGDLYRYSDSIQTPVRITVNGEETEGDLEDGYARIQRVWAADDRVELHIPMPVRRVACHESVECNRGRIALERGPVVFCAEGVDNDGTAKDLTLSSEASLEAVYRADLLNGLTVVSGGGITAIPYYAWGHRGEHEMAVWLREE